MQAKIEGPLIAEGRLEAPEPQARIYAYTKGDIEAGTSYMVTSQKSIATHNIIALFDTCTTHSLVSLEFAQKLGKKGVKLVQPFKIFLLSGEILLS